MSEEDGPPFDHRQLAMRLDALRATVPAADLAKFDNAVNMFGELNTFFASVTLLTWGCYFPMHDDDTDDIVARVFAVVTDLVPFPSTMPACPKCGKATLFKHNINVPFGWEFWCVDRRQLSRQEARRLHASSRWICTGAIQATHNTWFENVRSISRCLGLTFCWLNSLAMMRASMTVGCTDHTAVDHYSMIREVCKVIMSNEVRLMLLLYIMSPHEAFHD